MIKFTLIQSAVFALLLFFSAQVNSQIILEEHQSAIANSQQGHIVQLPGFFNNKFDTIEYQKIIIPGPQYLISDDPEYIRIPEAIAFQESVEPGTVRLYVYNVNGVEEPKNIDRKITAVIKNTGSSTMHLRMLKYSSQKPSGNYYKIGKEGLADYFASQPVEKIKKITPGNAIAIDEKLEEHIVKYNDLVHGFYEFVIDQPGEISVLQTSPEKTGPEALQEINEVLPPKVSESGAGRGKFGVSNYKIVTESVYNTADGPAQIIVADGNLDPWVTGTEGTTGKIATLAGNYGVLYNVEMKWKSTNGKGLALLTYNMRAGDNRWCGGMAASMVVSDGKFAEGIIQLPKDQLVTRKAPEAILIQIFRPDPNEEEQTITLKYSPPGASCLPMPLIFVPIDLN